MKYVFYSIGVNDSNLNKTDVEESFSVKHLKQLPERHKKHMIELLRVMADDLETGVLSVKLSVK